MRFQTCLGVESRSSNASVHRPLAVSQEFHRTVVIQALDSALRMAQPRDALLPPTAAQSDPDLLFRRILLAGCSPNVFPKPLGRRLLVHGFLSHLHSLMVTMIQKSSFLQPANSVSQVLIPDTTLAEFGD